MINAPLGFYDRSGGKHRGKGKKMTLEVESEPIAFALNTEKMEGKLAAALAREIRKRIDRVNKPVSVKTIARRQRYARELAAGKRTAKKRYSGGKIGTTPPQGNNNTWLSDSGRLSRSVVATFNRRAGDLGGWTINVAANRLSSTNFDRNGAQFQRFIDEFSRLVSIRDAVKSRAYNEALSESLPDLMPILKRMRREQNIRQLKMISRGVMALLRFGAT